MWIKLKNKSDRRYVSRLYGYLTLAMVFRPSVGTLLPNLTELTGISVLLLMLVFTWVGAYLYATDDISLILYIFFLLPLAFFSAYIVFFMLTNPNSSMVLTVFIAGCWYSITQNLYHRAMEAAAQ